MQRCSARNYIPAAGGRLRRDHNNNCSGIITNKIWIIAAELEKGEPAADGCVLLKGNTPFFFFLFFFFINPFSLFTFMAPRAVQRGRL